MNEERIKLLEEVREAASKLASFASYAEIVGGIHHNRSQIREHCDTVYELLAKIKHMDENKTFRIKFRDPVTAIQQRMQGQVYKMSYGWLVNECDPNCTESEWYPNDPAYPEDGPRDISILDLEEVTDD